MSQKVNLTSLPRLYRNGYTSGTECTENATVVEMYLECLMNGRMDHGTQNQYQNSAFFDTHINLCEGNIFCMAWIFLKGLAAIATLFLFILS
jgi:hypothetical protein